MAVPDLVLATETLPVTVDIDGVNATPCEVTITDEHGRLLTSRQPKASSDHVGTGFTELHPGAHTITVGGVTDTSPIPGRCHCSGLGRSI